MCFDFIACYQQVFLVYIPRSVVLLNIKERRQFSCLWSSVIIEFIIKHCARNPATCLPNLKLSSLISTAELMILGPFLPQWSIVRIEFKYINDVLAGTIIVFDNSSYTWARTQGGSVFSGPIIKLRFWKVRYWPQATQLSGPARFSVVPLTAHTLLLQAACPPAWPVFW